METQGIDEIMDLQGAPVEQSLEQIQAEQRQTRVDEATARRLLKENSIVIDVSDMRTVVAIARARGLM